MRRTRPWWRLRRIKHRDAVALCILSSAFLFAGELTVPILQQIYTQYLEPVQSNPALLAFRLGLILLGYTTAFGALLVLLGGWYFLRGAIPRGRFCVGLGIGLTSLLLVSRIAYSTLAFGTPLAYLVPLATSLTGLGILFGVAAHTTMGSYALLVKRRAALAIRRWRRARRARGSRSKGSGSRG